MTDTCMNCNENTVDVRELYCQHCSLDQLVEAMVNSDYYNQLFLTAEAK